MPATTGGRPSSGSHRSNYRRPKKKRTYTLPDYGSEKNQSPRSAPKTGSNPTGSGDAPVSRIPKKRRRRQVKNAAEFRRDVRRANKRIERKERKRERRAERRAREEAGRFFAGLPKPGRSPVLGLMEARKEAQERTGRAIKELPNPPKPPKPSAEDIKREVHRATRLPKQDRESKAFKKYANKDAARGYREEHKEQPEFKRMAKGRAAYERRRAAEEKRLREKAEKAQGMKAQDKARREYQEAGFGKGPAIGIADDLEEGLLGVVDVVNRPLYATAGGVKAAVKGDNVAKAALEGIKGKRTLYSDVLKELGMKGDAAAILGFTADVVADPTTWASLGTAAPAKVAAKTAGRNAALRASARVASEHAVEKASAKAITKGAASKAALRAYRKQRARGASEAAAKEAAETARRETAERVGANRTQRKVTRAAKRAEEKVLRPGDEAHTGLTIGMGQRFRTSGKSTAAAHRIIAEGVGETKLGRGVAGFTRDSLRRLSPHVKKEGVSRSYHEAAKGAGRESRAISHTQRERAVAKAFALRDEVEPHNWAEVIDRVERRTGYELEALKTKAAKRGDQHELERLKNVERGVESVEKLMRDAIKLERAAGVNVGRRSGYVRHILDDLDGPEQLPRSSRSSAGKAGFKQDRRVRATVQRAAELYGVNFSTDMPRVIAERLAEGGDEAARAYLQRELVRAGTPIRNATQRLPDEGYAYFKKGRIHWAENTAHAQRLAARGVDVRLVDRKFAEELVTQLHPTREHGAASRGIDKLQGYWKLMATVPNLGFHARNMAGDTWNAYLGQNVVQMARNLPVAVRALHYVGARERAAYKIDEPVLNGSGTTMVRDLHGNKMEVTLADLAQEARKAGAIRTGFMKRELPELVDTKRATHGGAESIKAGEKLKTGGSKAGKVLLGESGLSRRRRVGRFLKRLIHNREDLMRLVTYTQARREGLTPRGAAARSVRNHFDYSDLSKFEREALRRIVPFYTFTSRNLPLQMKSIALRPGKYANFEKFRQEVGAYFEIDMDRFDEGLREYQERNLPMPIEIDGVVLAVNTQIPISDLHMVPWAVFANPTAAREYIDWGAEVSKRWLTMVSPIIRAPLEIIANKNLFFGSEIEDKYSPRVAAPSFVMKFPKWAKDALGVQMIRDRESGEMVPGWSAYADYASKIVPGPLAFGQGIVTPGRNRRNQQAWHKWASYLGGVKIEPHDERQGKIEDIFNQLDDIEKDAGAAKQANNKAKADRLNKKKYDLQARLNQLYEGLGYKYPYFPQSGGSDSENPLDVLGDLEGENPLDALDDTDDTNPLDVLE